MSERLIDLGDQRLILSQELGSDFVTALESGSGESESTRLAREHLVQNPRAKLIGTRINEKGNFNDVETSLCRQMGLPQGSNLKDVRDRLAGREEDFLLVVSGLDNLPPGEQRRLRREAGKLKIKSVLV